ncbi:MAG: adenosylcobinamide-GDP ribazoletransferase [Firmicutes bacterium]|nr:adenosylcobinamide-GDP ribazoletransferase [Bacillota bacterium]
MTAFFFALSFLTRLPSVIKIEYNDRLPSRAMKFYPVVGVIIGLILILLDYLFSLSLPVSIRNILLLIALIYLTGGLHLDGFIDTIDGIFSCREKEKILSIMHDSLIGSFGAVAIILLLILKYKLFMELAADFRAPLFILMPAISRFMAVFAAYNYPLATSSKLAKEIKSYLTNKEPITAGVYLLILSMIILYLFSFPIYITILIFIFTYLVITIFANYVVKLIDGLTGDVYGAIIEISEILVLLSFLFVNRLIVF